MGRPAVSGKDLSEPQHQHSQGSAGPMWCLGWARGEPPAGKWILGPHGAGRGGGSWFPHWGFAPPVGLSPSVPHHSPSACGTVVLLLLIIISLGCPTPVGQRGTVVGQLGQQASTPLWAPISPPPCGANWPSPTVCGQARPSPAAASWPAMRLSTCNTKDLTPSSSLPLVEPSSLAVPTVPLLSHGCGTV